MSLLDSDLMEKIDVPMIFEAINKLKKVMDDNLDKIVEHEKEISDLYKNVTNAKSELTNISTLLEQIVNPQKQPKYLVDLMDRIHNSPSIWFLDFRIFNLKLLSKQYRRI